MLWEDQEPRESPHREDSSPRTFLAPRAKARASDPNYQNQGSNKTRAERLEEKENENLTLLRNEIQSAVRQTAHKQEVEANQPTWEEMELRRVSGSLSPNRSEAGDRALTITTAGLTRSDSFENAPTTLSQVLPSWEEINHVLAEPKNALKRAETEKETQLQMERKELETMTQPKTQLVSRVVMSGANGPSSPSDEKENQESGQVLSSTRDFFFPSKGAAEGIAPLEEQKRYPKQLDYKMKPYFPLNGQSRGHVLPNLSQVMRTLGAKKYEFIGETRGKRLDFIASETKRDMKSVEALAPRKSRPGTAASSRYRSTSRSRPSTALSPRSRPGTALSSRRAGSNTFASTSRPGTAVSRPGTAASHRSSRSSAGDSQLGKKVRSATTVLLDPSTLTAKDSEEVARLIMKKGNIHGAHGANKALSKGEVEMLKYTVYDDFARYLCGGQPSLFDDYDMDGSGCIEMKELIDAVKGWIEGNGDTLRQKAKLSEEGRVSAFGLQLKLNLEAEKAWKAARRKRGGDKALHMSMAPRPSSRHYADVFAKKKRGGTLAYPHLEDMGGTRREQHGTTLILGTGSKSFDLRPMNSVSAKTQLKGHLVLNRATVVKGTIVFKRLCKAGEADMNIFDQIMQQLGSKDTYINDRLFRTFDADGSGSIDCNEFTLGLTSLWDTGLKADS